MNDASPCRACLARFTSRYRHFWDFWTDHLPKDGPKDHLPKDGLKDHLPKDGPKDHLPKDGPKDHLPKDGPKDHLPKDGPKEQIITKRSRRLSLIMTVALMEVDAKLGGKMERRRKVISVHF